MIGQGDIGIVHPRPTAIGMWFPWPIESKLSFRFPARLQLASILSTVWSLPGNAQDGHNKQQVAFLITSGKFSSCMGLELLQK